MPPERPAQLLDLPIEVKELICAQLCRHCSARSPLELITLPEADVSPLKALSETCAVFRDIAQSYLHHAPSIRSYACFFRTIRARPHLADSVKCLPTLPSRFDHPTAFFKGFIGEGCALMEEMATELQMFPPEADSFDDEFASMFVVVASRKDTDPPYFTQDVLQKMEVFRSLLEAVLIASLPFLEILFVNVGQGEGYPSHVHPHSRRRLDRAGRLVSDRCPTTSIPSLHTMVIGVEHTAFWKNFVDNYGIVLLDPHEVHFACAKSLRTLVFHGCVASYGWLQSASIENQSIWSTMPELREIICDEMKWATYKGYASVTAIADQEAAYLRIQQMTQQCHNLTSFKISVGWLDEPSAASTFSPSRLLQSLLPTTPRLERLKIHLDTVQLQDRPSILLGQDLHCFTKLHELSLDEMCFCHHWTSNGEAQGDAYIESYKIRRSNGCLVGILPLSVVFLNIRLRKGSRAVPDLVRLGNEAVAGHFPNLRHITVESYLDFPDDSKKGLHHSPWIERQPTFGRDLTRAPQIQAIAPKLAEAFRGSDVVVEVTAIRMRLTGPRSAVPLL